MKRLILLLGLLLIPLRIEAAEPLEVYIGNLDEIVNALGGGGGGDPAPSGGGSVAASTVPIFMTANGDIFIATVPTLSGVYYHTRVGTMNIVSVEAYHATAATYTPRADGGLCISTFAVVLSTGHNGRGITWGGIDASSWTVRYASSTAQDMHRPSQTTRILPGSWLYLFQMTDPQTCGGEPPTWGGVTLWVWWEP